ncbi:putative nucleotidyltransferase substrate binding domain-containing protein [Rhodococcus sp. OK302]|uniref:putative nucleotidyltransferase substrate binding domain-containing protein n=1 Tax=Rhodococcus sp. OK302 TaxID=1882769 RepID=UPI000B9F94F0|nr:putative nucleotidyltransferase substrate binding domain-containing protein [Rhodococcus sp. OK302]OYD69860.1 CBS domain-containing protein [Rhodococcus sp. OK302]
MTGHGPRTATPNPAMRPVRDLLHGPAIICSGETSIREAATLMTEAGRRAVVIPTDTSTYGIFTEGDLRVRVVVGGIDSALPVSSVMTPSAVTVDPERLGVDAVTDMLEHGLRHLPVVTATGAVLGVLELSDLLTSATNQGFQLRAQLATAPDDAALITTARAVPELVTALVASRVSPLDISATLSVLIDVTVRRAIELVVGGGESPDFAWLSLGSVARREALPSSDIDSALVWGGESHRDGADAAKRIHDILDRCGFPREFASAGTQARFARTLPQWREALRKWVSNPYQDHALVMLSMLADARVVAGDPTLDPRASALDQLRLHPAVMRLLLREAVGQKAKLHSLRDVMTRHTGTVNLKTTAVQPIVNIARWAGISVGARTSTTLERLKVAADNGFLPSDDAQVLIESFEVLQQIRVRHQTEQFAAGNPPNDEIVIADLTPLSRNLLGNAIREVAGVQRRLEYTASASAIPDIEP